MKLALVIINIPMNKHYTFLVQNDDILSSSVLQKRRLYTLFPGIKLDFAFTNKLGKIVLLFNNKDCCTRVKNKWCSNLLGTDTRVFSPNESRSHRGIIQDVPVEISTGDIKNNLAGEKEEEIQVIRYIKGGKAIPLVELVFQKECTFNQYLRNEITLEYMYFKMDPKRTTKLIIQCFNCQQWGSHVSKNCKNQSWCAICGYEHPTNRHKEYVCQEKHEHTKDCSPPKEIYCVNCGKHHTASDKNCEMYQESWKKLNRVNS